MEAFNPAISADVAFNTLPTGAGFVYGGKSLMKIPQVIMQDGTTRNTCDLYTGALTQTSGVWLVRPKAAGQV